MPAHARLPHPTACTTQSSLPAQSHSHHGVTSCEHPARPDAAQMRETGGELIPGQERTVSAKKHCSRATQISQSPCALPKRSRFWRTVPDTTKGSRGTTTICRRTSDSGRRARSSPASNTRPAATLAHPPNTAARPCLESPLPLSRTTPEPSTHNSPPARTRARRGSVKPLHDRKAPSPSSATRPSASWVSSNSSSCNLHANSRQRSMQLHQDPSPPSISQK